MEWIKNGPDVEKPKGNVLIHTMRYDTGCGDLSMMFVAEWSERKELWVTAGMYWPEDDDVTHFMEIKEPSDG